MKKILLSLIALLTLSCISCSPPVEKTRLTYGSYIAQDDATNGYMIDYESLNKRIQYDETMLVAIYPGVNSTCGCWQSFKDTIERFVDEYHYKIYCLNYYDIYDRTDVPYDFIKFDDRPTFHIISNKQIIYKLDYKDDDSPFHSHTVLKGVVDSYVNAPIMYEIDDASIDDKRNEEKSRIFYLRSTCGDCNYVIPNVLIPYFNNKETNEKLYVYDLDPLRNDTTNPDAYQNFKDNYGLSNAINTQFGYGVGYIPTFQYLENGTIKSQCVYFNDTIGKREDGSYYIADSYYTNERLSSLEYLNEYEGAKVLKDINLNAEDVYDSLSYISFKQEKAASYHDPLLKAFLDYVF